MTDRQYAKGGFVVGEPITVTLAPDECLVKFIDGRAVCVRCHERHDAEFWPCGVAQVPVDPR